MLPAETTLKKSASVMVLVAPLKLISPVLFASTDSPPNFAPPLVLMVPEAKTARSVPCTWARLMLPFSATNITLSSSCPLPLKLIVPCSTIMMVLLKVTWFGTVSPPLVTLMTLGLSLVPPPGNFWYHSLALLMGFWEALKKMGSGSKTSLFSNCWLICCS